MTRLVAGLVLAILGSGFAPSILRGQESPVRPPAAVPPLLTSSSTLQAALDRIAARSPLWRAAVEEVRTTGRTALVLTPDQVAVADKRGRRTRPFDPGVLAEVAPVPSGDRRVQVVLVVVNLPLLERIHEGRQSLPAEFEADLDRILVHEVYGHALPYLKAGDETGRCPDPVPGQKPADACAIRLENAVRAELGLGRRTDYGLVGMSAALRGR